MSNSKVETPEEFVNKNLNTDDIDTAIAITKDKDGQIQLSRNSKMDVKVLTDTLVLALTEMCKDPTFKHSFLESFSSISGVDDLFIKKCLENNGDLRSAEDVQLFLDEMLNMIKSEINPSGLAFMITNADPQELEENPETEVPVVMQISGTGNLLAYMVHEYIEELSGDAYASGKPNAFDPNKPQYAKVMRDFVATMDRLASNQKAKLPDSKHIKFKVQDKDKKENNK